MATRTTSQPLSSSMAAPRHVALLLWATGALLLGGVQCFTPPCPSLSRPAAGASALLRKAASRIARGVTPFSTISPAASAATTTAPVRGAQQPSVASYAPMQQYAGGDGQVGPGPLRSATPCRGLCAGSCCRR